MAQKKVIVRLFGAGPVSGYLPGSEFVEADGTVPLMDPGGKVIWLALKDIKTISYVRDFNLADAVDPERMGRTTFLARPRGDGIWVRITLLEGGQMEGIAASDMGFVHSLLTDRGIFFTPPDARGNTQRVFVPRTAMATLELVAVVTSAARKKAQAKPAGEPQPGLFE